MMERKVNNFFFPLNPMFTDYVHRRFIDRKITGSSVGLDDPCAFSRNGDNHKNIIRYMVQRSKHFLVESYVLDIKRGNNVCRR